MKANQANQSEPKANQIGSVIFATHTAHQSEPNRTKMSIRHWFVGSGVVRRPKNLFFFFCKAMPIPLGWWFA